MCGRFELHDIDMLPERYGITMPKRISASYNIAPTQLSPVITGDHAEMMAFGLIPFWSKTPKGIINARAETVNVKQTFKRSLEHNRCLIPANGFYEWKRADGKQPFYFHLKHEPIFSFAGIWDEWKHEGKDIKGFAIITTEPNALMAKIHNRMPVILTREEEEKWLNPDEAEPEKLLPLLDAYPASDMEAWPISKAVNRPSNNSPAVIQALPAT